ncbi:MAG: glutamate synthase large subunit [Pseudomonadota bacterium]
MPPIAAISRHGLPQPQGLYDPSYEHDACGVGLICRPDGIASHGIVRDGLTILENLSHRGACGCDETTGDGAGILIQMPHRFFKKAVDGNGVALPGAQDYGAGLVFLPPDSGQRRRLMTIMAEAVAAEGQVFLGWHTVPTAPDALGDIARQLAPAIRQIFIGRGRGIRDTDHFERTLYVIRKRTERMVRSSKLPQRGFFHVCSLSCRTLVYKGMLLADQITVFFPDLCDPEMTSAFALVHQRYSTNTFPTWDLAQPFRFICHNGEINTLRGNVNWMRAREPLLRSPHFGDDLSKLFPIATPGASDSAILDTVVELLCHGGRTLPHAMMMLIPEAWQHHESMPRHKKAFYDYHTSIMEPWDGPAAIAFADGRWVGAMLDRNGLRPSRYTVTCDGVVVMASETGVLDIPAKNVDTKGRLQPGRMFLIDMEQGRIVDDAEIKDEVCGRRPYADWLAVGRIRWPKAAEDGPAQEIDAADLLRRQIAFGYDQEDLKWVIGPMAAQGAEPVGSMGDDTPSGVLSRKPRLITDYFRQLFAQVTNPPLDAIREALVTSLATTIGAEGNLLDETAEHCCQLTLEQPVLTPGKMAAVVAGRMAGLRVATLPLAFPVDEGGDGLAAAMKRLCAAACDAVDEGGTILVLTDRGCLDQTHAPIPALLAVSGVHHHLIQTGRRQRCGIVVETGDARDVHHFCCLIGYGAGAVHPYLAFESIADLVRQGRVEAKDAAAGRGAYIKAVGKGLLKVMSKMGVSTLHSYRGAQMFECVGLDRSVVDTYFPGTSSRIAGADLAVLAEEIRLRHRLAFPRRTGVADPRLPVAGKYQWRRGGEVHQYTPETIARLHQAVRNDDAGAWAAFAGAVDAQNREEGLIRGLFALKDAPTPLPMEAIEPVSAILRRFKTGAMSYGSISREAHETLAKAMNRIGGKSNSGEGGEDDDRYTPDDDGDWRNSAIKQVASGRFGVNAAYLASAADIQIKMAQGAKPGEGGQLPAFKVYPWIAKTRHATPYVGLISPPPHHDIYSIEDLSQLIYDLKCANPMARIAVKLVSEVGVGTVAAGVAKGKADVILISGESGGTGAAPLTSIRHAGIPWELGLAEAHQTLTLNGLRARVALEVDGQLKTARDIAVACLLGAEEFGFGTIALVALGCVMMRVCHLNTCPVGIATQDPELRKRFTGRPEYVTRLMTFIAEDLRRIMARLGFRSVAEMVGRTDRLHARPAVDHWKARGLDFSGLLVTADMPEMLSRVCTVSRQDHGLDKSLDRQLMNQCREALDSGVPVTVRTAIRNVHRTLGTQLSYEITKRTGAAGLPDDTIVIHATGSAGQSFFAFATAGLTAHVTGDANDYFGKGLSGARLVLRPPEDAAFRAEENVIVGNVALYGATSGAAFIRGVAGERFCVRNSGATAVVEGVGDHGCEYMTGGRVVVLGDTGRNFAAGMSGGIAYVLDPEGRFRTERCNTEMVALETVDDPGEAAALAALIRQHLDATGSDVARRLLGDWPAALARFVKVIPVDYKAALAAGHGSNG